MIVTGTLLLKFPTCFLVPLLGVQLLGVTPGTQTYGKSKEGHYEASAYISQDTRILCT